MGKRGNAAKNLTLFFFISRLLFFCQFPQIKYFYLMELILKTYLFSVPFAKRLNLDEMDRFIVYFFQELENSVCMARRRAFIFAMGWCGMVIFSIACFSMLQRYTFWYFLCSSVGLFLLSLLPVYMRWFTKELAQCFDRIVLVSNARFPSRFRFTFNTSSFLLCCYEHNATSL